MVEQFDVNLLLSNATLYKRKAQTDFDICIFTFSELQGFRTFFQIICTTNKLIICKVIFKQVICLQSNEIVYVRINYTNLLKERSFIMTITHFAAVNTLIDYKTLKIIILTNLTKKILKIARRIQLDIIHEYTDTIYIIIDIFRTLIVLIAIVAIASAIDPLTSV